MARQDVSRRIGAQNAARAIREHGFSAQRLCQWTGCESYFGNDTQDVAFFRSVILPAIESRSLGR